MIKKKKKKSGAFASLKSKLQYIHADLTSPYQIKRVEHFLAFKCLCCTWFLCSFMIDFELLLMLLKTDAVVNKKLLVLEVP